MRKKPDFETGAAQQRDGVLAGLDALDDGGNIGIIHQKTVNPFGRIQSQFIQDSADEPFVYSLPDDFRNYFYRKPISPFQEFDIAFFCFAFAQDENHRFHFPDGTGIARSCHVSP